MVPNGTGAVLNASLLNQRDSRRCFVPRCCACFRTEDSDTAQRRGSWNLEDDCSCSAQSKWNGGERELYLTSFHLNMFYLQAYFNTKNTERRSSPSQLSRGKGGVNTWTRPEVCDGAQMNRHSRLHSVVQTRRCLENLHQTQMEIIRKSGQKDPTRRQLHCTCMSHTNICATTKMDTIEFL